MGLAVEHLLLRLRPLHRRLRAAVERRGAVSERTTEKGVDAVCVTARDAALLLDHLDDRLRREDASAAPLALDSAEIALEKLLRARAADESATLPLDALEREAHLDADEIGALLVAVAPEIDGSYELVYGFVVDDLARRFASVELVSALLAGGARGELALRRKLGAAGSLQRRGLLEEAPDPTPTGRHRVLKPTRRALAFLLSGRGDACALFRDPWEIATRDESTPPGVEPSALERLARALATRRVDVLGVWGPAASAREDAVTALARRAGLVLRRLDPAHPGESVAIAEECDALLWCDADALRDHGSDAALTAFVEQALQRTARICFSGTHPLRPLPLLLGKRFAELWLDEPTIDERARLWREALPGASDPEIAAIATRMRLDPLRIRAAARVAHDRAAVELDTGPLAPHLDAALGIVTRSRGTRFTTLIEPRRRAEDLVLPQAAHRAVLEVAAFARAAATVSDRWGMGRMITGGGGIKALFTGESGTGKTLAAEIIAHELGVPLLRVDLARVVSKWVGETEQNLEVAFSEAEATQAVLFFDEADALFGKRGQVQRGADRYANLEVSYLLQRLEDYAGVAVLATNLRENVDVAFTRRFQAVVHFPRPGAPERLRIWRRAFPSTAPLCADVDLDMLAGLDMTGASIVSSARTAALLTAERGDGAIRMDAIVRAVARQFQREARILTPRDLGPYARVLEG